MLDLRRFDRRYNVETAGLIDLDKLRVDSANKVHGVRYGGVTQWKFREIMNRIPLRAEELNAYSFIDFGSGKGAALMHASDYPFAKIVGVEFAEDLHRTALQNLETFRNRKQKCRDIVSIFGDAGQFAFPEGPWIMFLNVPFGIPVWKQVIQNVENASPGNGTSYLIYLNYEWLPETAEFVAGLPLLKLIDDSESTRIYQLAPTRL